MREHRHSDNYIHIKSYSFHSGNISQGVYMRTHLCVINVMIYNV